MKMMCKLFGHKWRYYVGATVNMHFKVCRHCGYLLMLQQFLGKEVWIDAVPYTKKGAKDMLQSRGLKE